MKAKIISKTDNQIILLCPANNFKAGQEVIIDSDDIARLRRSFHPLLHEWIDSGYCPYGNDFLTVKQIVKRDLGEGFECYYYSDDSGAVIKEKDIDEIPDYIRADHKRIRGLLKSTENYTRGQYSNLVNNLINQMDASGCNSKRYHEIREGMNG